MRLSELMWMKGRVSTSTLAAGLLLPGGASCVLVVVVFSKDWQEEGCSGKQRVLVVSRSQRCPTELPGSQSPWGCGCG